jgi:DNA-binding cell septation regulator SpoVG
MRDLRVSDLRYTPARRAQRDGGLYGFASFVLDGAIHFDCVAVRRTQAGRWSLSFPERRDAHGVVRTYVRPFTNAARDAITTQVIAALQRGARLS